MEITEVRVKLVQKSKERLRAFCSITLDSAFVIRDLKVIGGGNSSVFVAMPSRKLSDRCPKCRSKNHLRAKFCNECGQRLSDQRVSRDAHGRARLHADVAHPINTECREMIQQAVLKAFEDETEKAKSPDYRPPRFDDVDETFIDDADIDELERGREPAGTTRNSVEPAESEQLDTHLQSGESAFSDYDSLIADLRKEAASRDDRRRGKYDGRGDRSSPRNIEEPLQVKSSSQEKAQNQSFRRDDVKDQSPGRNTGAGQAPSPPEWEPGAAADTGQGAPIPCTPSLPIAPGQAGSAVASEDDSFGAGLI